MPNVRLDGGHARAPHHVGHRAHLDRIAKWRARAMSLYASQLSARAAGDFEGSFEEQDLASTGRSVVAISAGAGCYEVDYGLSQVIKSRMTDNGIGCDLVCAGSPPLHTVTAQRRGGRSGATGSPLVFVMPGCTRVPRRRPLAYTARVPAPTSSTSPCSTTRSARGSAASSQAGRLGGGCARPRP